MMDRYIVGAGGANFDIHIKTDKPPLPKDSNPGKLHTSAGGVCRNILENLSRMGGRCVLLSAVGSDSFGDSVLESCRDADIDVSRVCRSDDLPTSVYIDMLDDRGDMFVAANDMRLIAGIPPEYFEDNASVIGGASAVVIDANLGEEQIAAILKAAEGIPVFADPVSAAKCRALKPFTDKLQLIKPNRLELEALTGMPCGTDEETEAAAKELVRLGAKQVVVSLGAGGCLFADGSTVLRMDLDCDLPVVNASGAGDAFTAGLVHGWLNGADPETLLHYALACGRIATLSADTINGCLTEEYVFRFMDKYPVK